MCDRLRHRGYFAFTFLGIGSLLWFLARIITKPSRIHYPCMRAAAPMAGTFICWLIGIATSMALFRKALKFFRDSRYVIAAGCIAVCAAAGAVFFSTPVKTAFAVMIRDDAKTVQPLKPPVSPAKVAVIRDQTQNIPRMVQDAVTQSLGPQGMGALVKNGATVFIHPNIVYKTAAKDHKITDYRIVQAIVDLVKAAGAGTIIIGEGTSQGDKNAMSAGGYTAANFPGCQLVDLNDETLPRYEITLVEGVSAGPTMKKRIAKQYIDADVVIGVSKMKTHICAGMTGALKLALGIPAWSLYKTDLGFKWKLHDYLHQNIVDINLCRAPDFSVTDALLAMDGQGPGDGDVKKMDLILASRDPVALDAVACQIMDIPSYRITHLVLASNMNLGILDPSKIDVLGTPVTTVKSAFKRASPYPEYGINNYCGTTPLRPRKTDVPVTIDGNLSEFANAVTIEANTVAQVVKGSLSTWAGPADGSFTAKIMYDSLNMYFGITVLDSAKKPNTGTGSDIENGSAVEVYLSSRWPRFTVADLKDTAYMAQRDYRIGFSYAANPVIHVFSNPSQTISGLEVKKADTAGGYLMEIKLPLAMFQSFAPAKYREIGLNVVVDKAGSDGTRKNKIAWEPNSAMEKNSLAMGVAYFFPAAGPTGVQFFPSDAQEFMSLTGPVLTVSPASFSGGAKVSFIVPDRRSAGGYTDAEVSIFSFEGKKVATLLSRRVLPGKYELPWNGEDASGRRLGAGKYVCTVTLSGKARASAAFSILR